MCGGALCNEGDALRVDGCVSEDGPPGTPPSPMPLGADPRVAGFSAAPLELEVCRCDTEAKIAELVAVFKLAVVARRLFRCK